MAASYPSATKSFSTHTSGQTIASADINGIQDEVVAIETGLRDGITHALNPLTDAAHDLGTASLKWRDLWLSRNAAIGGTLGVTGVATFAASAPIVLSHASGGVKERNRSFQMGEWTAVAYNAGNYTASSGNWTVDSGDQTTLAYTLVGKTMTVAFYIQSTDVSATPAGLRIAIPGSFIAARTMSTACGVIDAGTSVPGLAFVAAAGTTIEIRRADGTNFTATSSDNTETTGTISFEVQ